MKIIIQNNNKMEKKSDLIGKYVIVRDNMAGVFFGILEDKQGTELTLKDARKFYKFSGAYTVEDLADKGAMNPSECNLTVAISQIVLSNFCQLLPCTKRAIEQNKSIPVWKY